jgi:hypothetical protein
VKPQKHCDGNGHSEREEAKALPIVFRLTPGVVLPNRVYVLSAVAVEALQDASLSSEN